MKIEYQINEKECIKLMFYMMYRKPILIFLNVLSLILFSIVIIDNNFNNIPMIFLIAYTFIFIPIFYYFRFKKSFSTNKIISAVTITEFQNDKFSDTTDSLFAEIAWENVYKIEELKSWFLFHQNSTQYGFCPKRVMTNDQIIELRNLIKKNVEKFSLRND